MKETVSEGDLVARLREHARGGYAYDELVDVAADEIERLQAALAAAYQRGREDAAAEVVGAGSEHGTEVYRAALTAAYQQGREDAAKIAEQLPETPNSAVAAAIRSAP